MEKVEEITWKIGRIGREPGEVGGRIGKWGLGESERVEKLATKSGRDSLKKWEVRRKSRRQGNHLMALIKLLIRPEGP